MTVLFGLVILAGTVIGFGIFGASLIRSAAPALMRVPRLAVLTLMSALGIWLFAVMAIGPMLAWLISGPNQFMPGASAQVCQRCLQAASPLQPGAEIDTIIPVVLLLLAPLLLLAVILITGSWLRHRRQNTLRTLSKSLPCDGNRKIVAGHNVLVLPSQSPIAFALPKRRCGIVISPVLLELLDEQELRAVLAHEAAHLKQRHHLVLALLHGVIVPLRWIPLVAAIADAVPHYLEMAADNAARSEVGTPALASALLKLGEKPKMADRFHGPADSLAEAAVTLHAAGADRIRQLVAPASGRLGIVPVAGMLGLVGILMISSVTVHVPYLQAVLAGCLT
ncbi:MAG: M56 family metallopeptidase [Yaniella sp.]|uniref:M56 family metallopeptidase n=1 Tax=Yaniella sp. TaxID=2773929 RepID=UPI002649AFC6|nr:M56 family metallopeptidase [Yaniella sp.]MDN5818377.1 M56 family metallopeptidase [Yaniella sp.]MDN6520803.1 M56 family metallopeptidase [Yaniella sp.]